MDPFQLEIFYGTVEGKSTFYRSCLVWGFGVAFGKDIKV